MATQVNGYVIVPHNSYDEFRSYALTHAVNVDYRYGNQCYDICALLWYQYGLSLQTGNGYVYGCWTIMRNTNARSPFIAITDKNQIKKGDVLVFNHYGSYYTGHIGFADEDYHGNNRIRLLGQNQGQGSGTGQASNVKDWSLTYFLGAFRNTRWDSTPPPTPTPTPSGSTEDRDKFPWAIFTNKISKRWYNKNKYYVLI